MLCQQTIICFDSECYYILENYIYIFAYSVILSCVLNELCKLYTVNYNYEVCSWNYYPFLIIANFIDICIMNTTLRLRIVNVSLCWNTRKGIKNIFSSSISIGLRIEFFNIHICSVWHIFWAKSVLEDFLKAWGDIILCWKYINYAEGKVNYITFWTNCIYNQWCLASFYFYWKSFWL